MRYLPTNQIWRYWGFETFLADVASEGARAVDLWLCNCHVNIDAHGIYNALTVSKLMRDHGVHAATLTPEQSNPKAYNIAAADTQVRRLTLGYYCQIVRLASLLGAQRISLNGGWFAMDEEPARAWDAMVGSLAAICDMAAGEGISVCLETLVEKPYRLVTDCASCVRALADTDRPNLLATLDTSTIARNGEELSSYLDAVGDRLGYVHLTNYNPHLPVHLAWGDERGVLDARHVTRALAERGYRGDCALEATCPTYYGRPREVISRALNSLKGCEC